MRLIVCQLTLSPGSGGTTNALARAHYASTQGSDSSEEPLLENASRLHSSPLLIGDLCEAIYIESIMTVVDARAELRRSADPQDLVTHETVEIHSFGVTMPMQLLDLPADFSLPHQEVTIAISTTSGISFGTMVSLFHTLAAYLTPKSTWKDVLSDQTPVSAQLKTLWTHLVRTCSRAVSKLLAPTSN